LQQIENNLSQVMSFYCAVTHRASAYQSHIDTEWLSVTLW